MFAQYVTFKLNYLVCNVSNYDMDDYGMQNRRFLRSKPKIVKATPNNMLMKK